MDKNLKNEIDELLYLTLEGTVTDDQIRRLNDIIGSDPKVQQYVSDYYLVVSALRKGDTIVKASLAAQDEISEINSVLSEMASYEKAAPSIEIIKSGHEAENKAKPHISDTGRKISPFSLVTLIISAAALLFLIIVAKIPFSKVPVAVLSDSIDAKWSSSQTPVDPGFVFNNTDKPRVLRSGVVEIAFESGAEVVIEGPSEFVCVSDNQISLHYGRLYARVPSWAIGFTVETENSRIVDLGTEFGVKVNVDGTTELHVTKGLTRLLAGIAKEKEAFAVEAGQAKHISDTAVVSDISLSGENFARQINSKTNLIRRGQTTIDLADIIGYGNGFGTGRARVAIDPVSAKLSDITIGDRTCDNTYRPVAENPFIDGIFVPDGNAVDKQVISSDGLVFENCPATRRNFYLGAAIGLDRLDGRPIVFDGVDYGLENNRSIFMHANLGITFDLGAIRSQLSDVAISGFRTTTGLCDTSWHISNADFWILVDGKVRYSRRNVTVKGQGDFVNIELSDDDRFLTLITTDGGDPDVVYDGDNPLYSIQSDWCIFAEPVLVLE